MQYSSVLNTLMHVPTCIMHNTCDYMMEIQPLNHMCECFVICVIIALKLTSHVPACI